MPKFMKNKSIELLEGGIESYLLGLYGMNLPTLRRRRMQDIKYAPIMGMFGAAIELIVKSCLVQAHDVSAMYKDNNANSTIYKFGTACIDELKKEIRDDKSSISFIWKDETDKNEHKDIMLYYLNKFRLLQEMRANGLHAGIGCSRDIAVVTANDVYSFIQLLSNGKRLKPYLKGIPAPEATIRDREMIIEDLQRRLVSKKGETDKVNMLRGIYLVLPYIPELKPDWIDCFDNLTVVPPTKDDVNYLVNTLQEAHSIFLLKSRGGKEGIPVRVENDNPEAIPISVQNIKRALNSIPEMFNQDVLSANTWLERGSLNLPIDDFLIDIFALGINSAKILQKGEMFTAQQVWPFVVSAYSTAGTPRPCWEMIRRCDELDKLKGFLRKATPISNGYFRRRVDSLVKCIDAYKSATPLKLYDEKDQVFCGIESFANDIRSNSRLNPITPQFIRNNPLSDSVASLLSEFMSGKLTVGQTIEEILQCDDLQKSDRSAVTALMHLCVGIEQRIGLVAILRSDYMKSVHSQARKQMFYIDFLDTEWEFDSDDWQI